MKIFSDGLLVTRFLFFYFIYLFIMANVFNMNALGVRWTRTTSKVLLYIMKLLTITTKSMSKNNGILRYNNVCNVYHMFLNWLYQSAYRQLISSEALFKDNWYYQFILPDIYAKNIHRIQTNQPTISFKIDWCNFHMSLFCYAK